MGRQILFRTCGGCEKVFSTETGKICPAKKPEHFKDRGLCEPCHKDVKEFVETVEKRTQ